MTRSQIYQLTLQLVLLVCFRSQVLALQHETRATFSSNFSEEFYQFCEFPSRPVGIYPLDKNHSVNDISPNHGTGKAVGIRWAPGIHGEPDGSLMLQGNSGSYVELDKGSLDTKRSLTILVFIHPSGSDGPIVNYKVDGYGVQLWETKRRGEGTVMARFNRRDLTYTSFISKQILKQNQWNYVGASYDYTTGNASLWYEGNIVTSEKVGKTQLATQFNVRLGALAMVGLNKYYKGRIACLQFYSEALTSTIIARARDACKPFAPVNSVTLAVHQDGRYVEVGDSVTFTATTDNGDKFSQYTFSPGDGSPETVTMENTLTYIYSTHGNFTAYVLIWSQCKNRSLHIEVQVTVEKPVELLEALSLSSVRTEFPEPTKFTLRSDRGTDFICTWDFGDGESSRSSHGIGIQDQIVRHAYNTTGNYSVQISCTNRLSQATASANAVVQILITGLSLSPVTPQRYREAFRITWQVHTGSHISFSASFAGKALRITKFEQNHTAEAWVLPEYHMGLGLYDVIVTAWNDVTQPVTESIRVLVEEAVLPFEPRLIHRNRDIEVREVFLLDMTNVNQINGAKPTFAIDFGDGEPVVMTENPHTNYSYPSYGDYVVSINASNHVSRFNITLKIKIHKPVILLEGLRLKSVPTRHPNPAVVTINIDRGSDFTCVANYSDGTVDERDYRRMFLFDPIRNPKQFGLKDLRLVIKHGFGSDGAFLLRLSCMNRLSELNSSIYIIVQSPVQELLLSTIAAQVFGKPINISWQIASGTNASFEVIFGGHRLRHEMNGTYASVLIGQEVYKAAGVHHFSVVVWNLVTSPISKAGQVTVEFAIEGLRAKIIHESHHIEVNETVMINASMVAGSNPKFVFDFGDNTGAFAFQSSIAQHSFNPQAIYIVKVTAKNNVSQESVDLSVTVQKPVIKLDGFSINAKPTNWSERTEILLRVAEGSDFQCYWQFGDGQRKNYSYSHLRFYKDGKDATKDLFTDLTFHIHHTYKKVGIYHPITVCNNRLSSTKASGKVVVEKPISGFQINFVFPQPTGKSFHVYWNVTSGTNVSYDVDFASGSLVSVTSYPGGGYANITSSIPGLNVFRVTGWNLVTPVQVRSRFVLVEVPLSNLSVMVSYESRDLEIGQVVHFRAQLTAGSNPSFLVNFGDGTEVASRLGHQVHNYSFHDSYLYGTPNHIYNVKVFAFNNVSKANASAFVKVYKPVLQLENLTLLTSPANVSVPTKIIVQLAHGTDVICSYDFGDGNITVVDFKDTVFLGDAKTPLPLFQNLSLEVWHIYKEESTYEVYVQCMNRHGKTEGKTNVIVQVPVSVLAIKKVSTVLFNESFEVDWTIQSGTGVKYEVYIGNITVSDIWSTSSGGKTLLTPEVYNLDGFHTITITGTNVVSSLSQQIRVTIQIPVSTIVLDVSYREPTTRQIRGGHEMLGDHFPALRDVIFTAKADAGTHLVYYWNITNLGQVRNSSQSNSSQLSSVQYNSTQLVTRKPVLHYKFQEMGKYNISVKSMNDLSQSGYSVNIIVLYPVDGLQFWSNSPQMMNRVMLFNITATTFGSEPCFALDTGGNYTYHQGYPWCAEKLGNDNFTVITELPDVLHYEHIYSILGQYPVTLNISNMVSFISFQTTIDVTLAPCSDPLVIIKNIGESSSQATRVYRSSIFTVKTTVTGRCSRTKKVQFDWQLQSPDQLFPNRTAVEDSDDLHSDLSLKSRELFLPKRSLPYGLYDVKFTARMDLLDTFQGTTVGYLEIIPSPLEAKISGGNLIRRGFGKKVNIDGSSSIDPDIIHGDSGLSYLWLCRSTQISFAQDLLPGIELPSTPYDTITTSLDRNSSYYKGCYGDGNFTLPGTQAVVAINTTRMRENATYVVMLVIKKGDRLAFAYQVLEVVAGDPPVLAIECKQNCAMKMNPSGRLSVSANCSDGCFGKIIYQWEVYHNKGDKVSKVWNRRDDISEANSVQDPNGPSFALPKDILEGNEEYLVRVYGGRENSAQGRSEYTSITNDPPRGGSCGGTPSVGEALISNFVFSCVGWTDIDTPLSYEFSHKDNGKLMLISFGENEKITTKLPLGDPKLNFTLEIYVKILDCFKGESWTVFVVQSLQPAMEASKLGDTLADMTSSEDSPLASMLGVGDYQAVFQMAGAMNSLLNAQDSPASSGSLNDTEEQRNSTAKKKAVRDALIAAAASAPVTSLEDLRQSAGVMSSSTAKKDETSNSAKNASAKAFQNMASVLKRSSADSAGYDAVLDGAESMLTGMGQVLNAASSSVKLKPKAGKNGTNATVLPTCDPFDFECKKKLEVQPTTTSPTVSQNDDEDDDDDDDEEEELDGDAKENRDVANNILGMLGSVGGSIVGNKLPGEKATVLATGGMEMTVERADPGSLGGSAIGEGPASFKMPPSGDLFKNANSSSMGAVDKQMTAMNDNPFTWDKSASAVSGQVVGLSFSSGDGKLDVSGLAEPMDIFVPRDTKLAPPEKFVYDPASQRGWSFHRLMIEKSATAASIEVRNSAPFHLFVRREKPPRLSHYDWKSSSGQPTNAHENQSTSANSSGDAESIMKEYNEYKSSNSRFGWLSSSVGRLALTLIPSAVHKFTNTSNSLDYSASLFMSDKEIHKGLYFIGIKYGGHVEMENRTGVPGTSADSNVTYTLRVYKSKCMYWNETKQKWKSNGCEVGNLTNLKRTHCRCNHLTSFGSALNVAPNPIDFSKVMAGFSNMFASGNVVVFFTIVGLFVLYPLLVMWARRADRKDLALHGATPIPANVPRAKYRYEITFFTGKTSSSGTTAQLACQLIGHKDNSGPCILKDDKRAVFQQRGVNSFIISVSRPLGDITRLRVWHDNHGLSPSWFLKKATVSDCQTGRVWLFLGEIWFAVDEGDGQIMRELEPATDEDRTQFKVLFGQKIDDGLSNAHLWFSVLYKTPRSRFTRVQRITCCLNLLCTGMVASAMFFGQVPEGGDPNAVSLGPIKLSLRCIMIGIQSSLVVIPVNVIVMTLFQNSKRKDPPSMKHEEKDENEEEFDTIPVTEVVHVETEMDTESEPEIDGYEELKSIQAKLMGESCEENEQCDHESNQDDSEEAKIISVEHVVCDIHDDQEVESGDVEEPDDKDRNEDYLDTLSIGSTSKDDVPLTEKRDKQGCCSFLHRLNDPEVKKKKEEERKRKAAEKRRKQKNTEGSLPHWCLYVAYVLCFFASVTSALFTLFYSMMWGKEKSNGWLVAFLFSFVQDTFINQPLKVFVVSILVALIVKKPEDEDDLEFIGDPEKGSDEEWLHEDHNNPDPVDRQQDLIMYQPPSEEQLAAVRERRLREKDMYDKLKKLVYYVSVLLVLLFVSKGNRDEKSFSLRRALQDGFVEPLSRTRKLDHVVNAEYFWDWAENSLVPGLFEHEWYNGDLVVNRTGFTEDRYNMLMGVLRFRQVRVLNGSCKINENFKDLIEECNAVYSKEKEDKRSFKPAWKDGQKDTTSKRNKKASPWEYFSGKEANQSSAIWGRLATYTGGGYIAELGDSAVYATNFIHYLKASSWIDPNTRAVFVEGSMYNPSVNLLAVLKVSVEFSTAGSAVPFFNINIMKLYRSLSPGYSLFIVCELIYLLILLQLLYSIIKGTYKERKEYYRRVLSWMDIVFFMNGIVVIGLYVVRARFIGQAVDILSKDQKSYIGFADLASYVELVVYLLALADFIAILKFLHFMSFTRSVKLLSETIFRCFVQLQSFSVMFFVVVMAYAVLSYTVFAAYLEGYMDIPSTIGSLFSLLMGVFDIREFELQSDFKVLGRFFFSTFSSIMMFLFLNFFITIINSVYKEVQLDESLKQGESDLFSNIFQKVLMSTGIQEPPKREIPHFEEPSIASIQWDLHTQYVLNSQMKRLRKYIGSLKADDEMWDLYLTGNLQRLMLAKKPGKPILRHDTERLPGNYHALPEKSAIPRKSVEFEECHENSNGEKAMEQWNGEEEADLVKSDSLNNEQNVAADGAPSSELREDSSRVDVTHEQGTISESPQVVNLRDLISKKEKELERLEEKGELSDNVKIRQEKIIACLKGLLESALSQQERRKQQEDRQDTADGPESSV